MGSFKKAINFKIILLFLAGLFLFTCVVYGIDLSGKSNLRLPNQLSTEEGRRRFKEMKWKTTMSDPRYHKENKFRYIVHAVMLPEERSDQQLVMVKREKAGEQIERNHMELLENPERISEKLIISNSLIDTEHTDTWSEGGFILRVPPDNILRTAPKDITAIFYSGKEEVEKMYKQKDELGIGDPDRILEFTSPYKYNEIVVTGTGRSGKKVEIIGVFVIIDSKGKLAEPRLAQQVMNLAYKYGWPIVRIQYRAVPYQDKNPDEYMEGENFAFNYKGKRYFFDTMSNQFWIYEDGGRKQHRMRPDERSEAVGIVDDFLRENPNPVLERLVLKVKNVSDEELMGYVEKERVDRKRKDTDFVMGELTGGTTLFVIPAEAGIHKTIDSIF